MIEPVVQIRDLGFARGERFIFDGIDLDIRPGSVTAIMGPSGTGKTTLLKLIGGQLQPMSGHGAPRAVPDAQAAWHVVPEWRAADGYQCI